MPSLFSPNHRLPQLIDARNLSHMSIPTFLVPLVLNHAMRHSILLMPTLGDMCQHNSAKSLPSARECTDAHKRK